MKRFLRQLFKLLYHQFAFSYDFVAAAVSFNHWRRWIEEILPFIEGTRILELGHGPGHLQRILRRDGWVAVGLDESSQMGQIARRNTEGSSPLVRGVSQHLPFPDGSFDTIISTFPSEYIYDQRTLAEARRCLRLGGRLTVLPAALPKSRILDWLYKFTGASSPESEEVIKNKLIEPFVKAGWATELFIRDTRSSRLFVIVANKEQAFESFQSSRG